MDKSESIGELSKALAKAQAQFTPVKRGTKVDFTTKAGARIKYNYAPLSDVIESCIKALNDNELVIVQPTKVEDNKIIVETMLIHSSGEWLSGEMCISPSDHNPQSEGSALTYARRYSLSALLSIAADEDDDGEGAMKRQKAESKAEPKAKPVAKQFASSPSGVIKSSKEVEAEEQPGDITDPQIRKINALLTFKKITDDKARHETVSVILGLPGTITSMKLLTKTQASTVIETLEVKE